MRFTATAPATLLALCLSLGTLTVQAAPERSLKSRYPGLDIEARSFDAIRFVCNDSNGQITQAECEDDAQCDCYCDVEGDVTCNGGANCPNIAGCLTDCGCQDDGGPPKAKL
jgi:hypothetical protein